jgi:hypothetical protein
VVDVEVVLEVVVVVDVTITFLTVVDCDGGTGGKVDVLVGAAVVFLI